MIGLLTASVTTAAVARTSASGAAKPGKVKPASKPKPVTTKVSCKLVLVTQPPANVPNIIPGAQTATQLGKAGCGKPLFDGVESDAYTAQPSGNLVAPYTLWFKGGTLAGKWTLVPTEQVGSPGTTPFAAQTYKGTATITGGSGAWAKASGKATLACATMDGVHTSCSASLKVTTPPAAATKSKKS